MSSLCLDIQGRGWKPSEPMSKRHVQESFSISPKKTIFHMSGVRLKTSGWETISETVAGRKLSPHVAAGHFHT